MTLSLDIAAGNHKTKMPDVAALQRTATDRKRQTPSRPLFFLLFASVLVMTFVIYSPTLTFHFVWDDHGQITDNPRIQFSGWVGTYFTEHLWAHNEFAPPTYYRPVFLLWLRMNYICFGLWPRGWHLATILAQLLATGLLGGLVVTLLSDRLAALLAMLLFAVHPAQAESVSWVSVPDPLMTAALLAALLLYIKYDSGGMQRTSELPRRKIGRLRRRAQNGKRRMWMLASVCCYGVALLVKETAIILPIIIFGLSLVPQHEDSMAGKKEQGQQWADRAGTAILRSLPFVVATAVYLGLRMNALEGRLGTLNQHLSFGTVLLSWPSILWFYVKVVCWPVRLRDFGDSEVIQHMSLEHVLLPALALVCVAAILSGVLWSGRCAARRYLNRGEGFAIERTLVLGILLLLLPILPALNVNGFAAYDFLHARYMYLPLAGVAILIAAGLHVLPRGRLAAAIALVTLCAALIPLNRRLQRPWVDDMTLWTTMHAEEPENWFVTANLGTELYLADRCGEALPLFRRVVQQNPDAWSTWAALGDCNLKMKDLPAAELAMGRAAQISGDPRLAKEWQRIRGLLGK